MRAPNAQPVERHQIQKHLLHRRHDGNGYETFHNHRSTSVAEFESTHQSTSFLTDTDVITSDARLSRSPRVENFRTGADNDDQ
jgi:hypothetical protein